MIIAVVGMPGAGKSTLVDVGTQQFGLPRVYFGGFVTQEVQRRGMPIKPVYEKEVREDLRRQHGMAALAKLALPEIEEALRTCPDVLLDGLYSWSEWVLLHSTFGEKLITVAVHAPRKLRHERLQRRPKRPLSSEEAAERDRSEIEQLEKGGPISNADHVLTNDGLPSTFAATCACAMAALCSAPIPLTASTATEGFRGLDATLQEQLLRRIRLLDTSEAPRFYRAAYEQARHPSVRGPVLKAMAEMRLPETQQLIQQLLEQDDPYSRRVAYSALGDTRTLSRIPMLASVLATTSDAEDAEAAAGALAKMGEPAAPALHEILDAPATSAARRAALAAVFTIGSPASETRVQQMAPSFQKEEKLLFLKLGDAYFPALRSILLEWSRSGEADVSPLAAGALRRST